MTEWRTVEMILHVSNLSQGQWTILCLQIGQVHEKLTERRAFSVKKKGVLLLHSNAKPHVLLEIQRKLHYVKWEVLPLPPYSPDIYPSNYYLYCPIFLHSSRLKIEVNRTFSWWHELASKTLIEKPFHISSSQHAAIEMNLEWIRKIGRRHANNASNVWGQIDAASIVHVRNAFRFGPMPESRPINNWGMIIKGADTDEPRAGRGTRFIDAVPVSGRCIIKFAANCVWMVGDFSVFP